MASDEALRLAAAVETLSGLIEDFGDSIDELDTRDLLEIPDTGERLGRTGQTSQARIGANHEQSRTASQGHFKGGEKCRQARRLGC
jgi:hypothetical protein